MINARGKVVSVVLLAFLLVAIPLVGACAEPTPEPTPTTTTPTEPEVIEWKLLSFSPETSSCSQRMGKDFADAINAACGGRLVITPYYGASLVPEAEYLTAVKGGAAEMMMVCATYYVGTMPVTNFEYGFPGTYRSPSDYYTHYERFGFRDILERAYAEHGVLWLGYAPDAGIPLLSTVPVNTVDDLKAMKIRASGGAALTLEKLGAAVTWIPGGELYTSLTTGVIDAVIYGSIDSLHTLGVQEVAKYLIYPKLIGAHMPITYGVSMDAWNELPDDLQAIIKTTVKSKLMDYYDPCVDNEPVYLNEDWIPKYGTEIMQLPDAEFAKIGVASLEVMAELAKEDPYCAEAFESIQKFMEFMGY